MNDINAMVVIRNEMDFNYCISRVESLHQKIKITQFFKFLGLISRTSLAVLFSSFFFTRMLESGTLTYVFLGVIITTAVCSIATCFIYELFFADQIANANEYIVTKKEIKMLASSTYVLGIAMRDQGTLSAASWLSSQPILKKYHLS